MSKLSFDDLKDQVCVITGGTGVIGIALARGLSSVGAKIALLYVSNEKAEEIARQIEFEFGNVVKAYKANVLDKSSLEQVKDDINKDLGPISLLINGAGGNSSKATTQLETIEKNSDIDQSFYGLDMDGFQWVFDLNFKGTLLSTMVFTKDMHMNGKGAVVNISSMNAYKPLTKIPAYSAAKASVNNFTEWLAVHMAKTGIRINAVAPGFFLTNQNRFLLTDEQSGKMTSRGEKIINNTPMGKFGEVEELQGAVLYLLSDLSKFVTGICIPVDGGFNAFGGV